MAAGSAPTTMPGPAELELFVLTFNCASAAIDTPVFARHLTAALTQRQDHVASAPRLPDLIFV